MKLFAKRLNIALAIVALITLAIFGWWYAWAFTVLTYMLYAIWGAAALFVTFYLALVVIYGLKRGVQRLIHWLFIEPFSSAGKRKGVNK